MMSHNSAKFSAYDRGVFQEKAKNFEGGWWYSSDNRQDVIMTSTTKYKWGEKNIVGWDILIQKK